MIKLFEKYTEISDVKEIILCNAINTIDLELVKFFVERGYNVNTNKVLFEATFTPEILKYLLGKKMDLNFVSSGNYELRSQLHILEIQKILIDFGYEHFIFDKIGFNQKLKEDPKYADVVERYEDAKKYNL